MKSLQGCGTGILLLAVGALAVPLGLVLPEDTLGMLFGAILGLLVLVPLCVILMMALQTRHREAERRIHVEARREVEEAQAQLSPGNQPARQWVIVGQNWATTPQQSAFRSSATTLEATRRSPRTTHVQQDVLDDVFYYEDKPTVTPPPRKSATAVRPVTPSPAQRALVPVRPDRRFVITGQVLRTDTFRVVGE